MSDKTHIEWTDATWNPITGCSVVSAGCKHCYAMKLAGTRLKHHPSRAGLTIDTAAGPVWNGEVRFNRQWIAQPLAWKRPRRIFVCAHGDLFHENVPDSWIDHVFATMALAKQHTFQLLTKRAERMYKYCSSSATVGRVSALIAEIVHEIGHVEIINVDDELPGFYLPNVWLGVSVEDQKNADERIPLLLKTPAAVRWISAEPLLGPVDLSQWLFPFKVCDDCPCPNPETDISKIDDCCRSPELLDSPIDWIVVGGESGQGARPMHPEWARDIRDHCLAAGVPFLFKQWGNWREPLEGENYNTTMGQGQTVPCFIVCGATGHVHCFEKDSIKNGVVMREVGKKKAGRLLDGGLHDGYPV